MIRLAEALDDAALVERRARGIAQGALCLGADELDGYERARGRETLSAPGVQWGFDVGCGGNRRFQNGAIRGISAIPSTRLPESSFLDATISLAFSDGSRRRRFLPDTKTS